MPGLVIDWLGQAGFIYGFPAGAAVCVDPYLSHSTKTKTRERLTPIPIPAWQVNADLVITTHDHSDHFDEITLRPMAEQAHTLFIGPSSCQEHWLEMQLPQDRFLRLDQGESLAIAGINLTAFYAEHGSGAKRDAIGVMMEANGWRIYHVGDSEYTDLLVENSRGLKPDLLTVPINGRLGNMNHEEAAKLTTSVEPRVVIPMHYGMFKENNADPNDFIEACRTQGVRAQVVLMKVGQRFELGGMSPGEKV